MTADGGASGSGGAPGGAEVVAPASTNGSLIASEVVAPASTNGSTPGSTEVAVLVGTGDAAPTSAGYLVPVPTPVDAADAGPWGGGGAGVSVAAAPVPERPAMARGHAGWPELAAVFVIALGLALTLFHEVLRAPFTSQIGGVGDADEYSWFLSWVPYAIGHGLNPLVSTYLNFPSGINLMWNTSVVFPSLVMAPITEIWGAPFSYNILVISAPVLTVTFCYLAFRRWTGRLPSLVGGLTVGFSPFMINQSTGHLAQILIISAPLLLIMLDRVLVVQASRPSRDGLLLGVLATAQLLTGEEVFAMEAIAAAIGIVVLAVLGHGAVKAHLRYATRALAVAAGSFLVLGGPFLIYQYLGPYKVQDVHPANVYVSDLFNFFVPTNMIKLAPAMALHVSAHFTGNGSEDDAYIGVPLLVLIALTLVLARRRRIVWVGFAFTLGAALLSMGSTLHIKGHITSFRLPDDVLQHLPFTHNLLPGRFAAMTAVGVGLLLALGCDEFRRLKWPLAAGGWALAAVGLVALVPITDYPAAESPKYWAFDTGLSCPSPTVKGPPGRPPVALIVPAVNEMNLRWQPEANFCFTMPSDTGMTGTNSGDVGQQGVLLTLGSPYMAPTPLTPATREEAAAEITDLDISEIVVGPEFPTVPIWSPHGQALAVVWVEWLLGQAPQQSHDAYISYIWKNLPPTSDIASGHVRQMPGLPPP